MNMPLAIHHREGSFSDRWQAYCEERRIPFILVNCLESDILNRLASADALLWHWIHQDAREHLMARHLILAAEQMGLAVFPSTPTCWHFDDKIAQKYLLEAVDAPLVPTHVFYDEDEALRWIKKAAFPKVFKLRKGAGSSNVHLVANARQARALTRRAFGRGFQPVPGYSVDARKRLRSARERGEVLAAAMRMPWVLARIRRLNKAMGSEGGYVYFQDFVPDNAFDTRVTVIGDRAFAFTRDVRPGDFRASGSGRIAYDFGRIDRRCVETAFGVTRKVGSQSMAFDFVRTGEGSPMIVEVSYCYDPRAVYNCAGHWDGRLKWHDGHTWPQDAILVDLIESLGRRRSFGVAPPSASARSGISRSSEDESIDPAG